MTTTADTTPSIATHNGKFTVTSLASGKHRTYEIRTINKGDLKGNRVVSVREGADYKAFAFLNVKHLPDTTKYWVNVWKKFRGDKSPGSYEHQARFLENLAKHEASGSVTINAATKCRRCNADLTDVDSIHNGIGPTCATYEE